MEKTNVKDTTTKSVKEWSPNEKQKDFLKELGNYPDGISLKELEIATGKKFATGTINTLSVHKLVSTTDKEYELDLVFNGVKVGSVKKVWKVYKLVD